MIIPTEPIGSIPPPLELIEAVASGNADDPALDFSPSSRNGMRAAT